MHSSDVECIFDSVNCHLSQPITPCFICVPPSCPWTHSTLLIPPCSYLPGAEFEVGGVKYVIGPHGILRSWRDAFYWCKLHDMMLATIPSHAEQQAIFEATRHLYGWFWIGGVYSPASHSWQWLNGMPIPSRSSQASSLSRYSYWGKGAPYGFKEFHCMAVRGGQAGRDEGQEAHGTWLMQRDTSSASHACRKHSTCQRPCRLDQHMCAGLPAMQACLCCCKACFAA